LQVLDRNGRLVETIRNANLLDGPWDLAVNDLGSTAQLFVTDVSTGVSATAAPLGMVTRVNLSLKGSKPVVQSMTRIASGYPIRTDPGAFVVGPGGLAYDARSGKLYVTSEVEKVNGKEVGSVFAIANAATRMLDLGEGQLIYADARHLHGPMGLVLAPNGDLIVANGDAVNVNPNQPSELVEFTPTGHFVSQFAVDPSNGAAFGIALLSSRGVIRFAAVNDVQSTVEIWGFRLVT
jgi:hypothetical protein